MLYVIKVKPSWDKLGREVFLRLYANKKTYTYRKHAATATKFTSADEARRVISQFQLEQLHPRVSIMETDESGSWTRPVAAMVGCQ